MSSNEWIGKTIGGRYQIEELLGQGGMSAVYKATDPNLRRVVAIKLIHPSVASDSRVLSRFEREAEILASLNHPHIATIHGVEEVDGRGRSCWNLSKGKRWRSSWSGRRCKPTKS